MTLAQLILFSFNNRVCHGVFLFFKTYTNIGKPTALLVAKIFTTAQL